MKKILSTLIAVFLYTMLSAQVTSDLVIYKGTDIEPNGKADDPIWSQVAAVPITNVFNYESPTVEAYFKMYYTDEYIYVLVDVTDDKHYPAWLAEDIKNEWNYDKVEVYLDINDVLKDGKGPAYIDGNMAAGHYQMAPYLEEGAYGVVQYPDKVLHGTLRGLVAVCYDMKPEDKGYTMEYRFPMYGFVNDNEEDMDLDKFMSLPQGMGFDVLIVDNDNDGNGRKRAVWKNMGPDEPYSNMDNCGVVTFSPDDATSIGNVNSATVKVYPNPAAETLTIEGDFDKVVFTTVTGQQVKVINGTINTLNICDLVSGIYVVETYQEGALMNVCKIVKR